MPGTYSKSVTFDCGDPIEVATFWGTVLGSNADEDSTPDQALVEAAGWGGADGSFVEVPEPKTAKDRVHFDLGAPGSIQDEVVRLTGLGVSVLRRRPDLLVMLDPGGSEVCVE